MSVLSRTVDPRPAGRPTRSTSRTGPPSAPCSGPGPRRSCCASAGSAPGPALAPLSSAAMAPGIVRVETERKTVQHLEGGIIAELLVREGDHVTAGQVLVRLDDLEAKALHDLLKAQQTALAAQQARLIAERDGHADMLFPGVPARSGCPAARSLRSSAGRSVSSPAGVKRCRARSMSCTSA